MMLIFFHIMVFYFNVNYISYLLNKYDFIYKKYKRFRNILIKLRERKLTF